MSPAALLAGALPAGAPGASAQALAPGATAGWMAAPDALVSVFASPSHPKVRLRSSAEGARLLKVGEATREAVTGEPGDARAKTLVAGAGARIILVKATGPGLSSVTSEGLHA